MFNKTTKIIILIIVILSLLAVLIFLKIRAEKKLAAEETSETPESIMAELKENHPEFGTKQLEFYSEIAARKDILPPSCLAENKEEHCLPCAGREDENDCVLSLAFLTRKEYFCGDLEEREKQFECSIPILSKKAVLKALVDECHSLTNDLSKTICLQGIFIIYEQSEDCLRLPEEAQKMCQSTIFYEKALKEENKKLCDSISDEYLKTQCLELIK